MAGSLGSNPRDDLGRAGGRAEFEARRAGLERAPAGHLSHHQTPMCGIAGIFHYRDEHRQAELSTLQRMTRSIAHRGPDDEGFFVSGPLGLGNRRLAIVDVSPAGHQPMKSGDGAACITYNGEFYNHQSFRPKLQAHGVRFRGSSDTETLLYALDTYGPGVLTDVAGIFGVAFWDARHQRLILARDPLGVKQLYYHDDGHRIVFASEIKALLQCADVPREIDPEAVNEYLHFHTPLFDRTFFRHINRSERVNTSRSAASGCGGRSTGRPTAFSRATRTPEEASRSFEICSRPSSASS